MRPNIPRGPLGAALFAAHLIICPPAWAQAASTGGWVADARNGCRVWNPHPLSGETIRWIGSCLNGYAEGPGSVQWSKGNIPIEQDTGEWRGGKQAGIGSQVWIGGRYDGNIVDGEPSGHGILTLQSARYEGEFQGGKPNGAGVMTTEKGTVQGTWKDGCLRQGDHKAAMGVPLTACP